MSNMKVSKQGLDLIKKFEGFRAKPYLCSADRPTIGYGNTFYLDKKPVTLKDPPITEETATQLLELVADSFVQKILKLVSVQLTQNELDALTSFTYNLGEGALGKSTLLKKLNAGDKVGAAQEFLKWTKAAGKELPGLVKRRKEEMELFASKAQSEPTGADKLTSSDPKSIFEEIDKKIF